jgi:uncharacterized protein (DUF1697 family)
MPTHVALLRGINVGGRSKLPMADLRRIVAGLGHTDVATYIQSGNVVFTPRPGAEPAGTAALARDLEQALAAEFPFTPRVVVLTRDELADAVAADPYPDEPDPKKVHVVFLTGGPAPEEVDRVADLVRRAAEKGSRDEARLAGRALYLHTPDGMGRSVLAELMARSPKRKDATADGTARNRRTVAKLLAMLDA